jgi:putative transposase
LSSLRPGKPFLAGEAQASVWNLARSSFYTPRYREQHPRQLQKRGPKVLSDEELVAEVRQLLADPIFTGEGYRKIWARLRHKSVCTSKIASAFAP